MGNSLVTMLRQACADAQVRDHAQALLRAYADYQAGTGVVYPPVQADMPDIWEHVDVTKEV